MYHDDAILLFLSDIHKIDFFGIYQMICTTYIREYPSLMKVVYA